MAKLLDYLKWRGDVDLAADGFNELDAAVFSRLAYVPFEETGGIEQKQGIELRELTAYLTAAPGIPGRVMTPFDLELCRQVSESERYGAVRVYGYESRFDVESETQFAAMSFKLGDGRGVVAFRGTDNTIIGWKEDLNMGLTFPVPAQTSSAEYLEGMDGRLRCDSYILCGHSKGGNLAVYAGAFCGSALQSRISDVYNFDGPGFTLEALETPGYKRIIKRVLTFVPSFSVFGMLFNNERPYTVVRSDAFGIMQHDIYSWEAERRSFVYTDDLTEASRQIDSALDAWIRDMSKEEREAFVDAVYQIFTSSNAQTLDELSTNKFENAMQTLKAIRRLDDGTRRNALRAVQLLMASFKS